MTQNTKRLEDNMNRAVLDVLNVLADIHGGAKNRCGKKAKSRAEKPPDAVENSGTSEGVRKSWEKRRRQFVRSVSREDALTPGESTQLHKHFSSPGDWHGGSRESYDAMKPWVQVAAEKVHKRMKEWKATADNCTARDVIVNRMLSMNSGTSEGVKKRQVSNSSMLAQISPSPMIGKFAVGKRQKVSKSRCSGKPKSAMNAKIDDDELDAGIKVELEHGPDREQAEKIARDHLREDPKYYSKLKSCGMEKQ